MNFKTAFFVLLSILLAFIIYHIIAISQIKEDKILNFLNFQDQELLTYFEDQLKSIDSTSGKFIQDSDAKGKVEDYHMSRRSLLKWPTRTHSYFFGTQKLRIFLNKIDAYNQIGNQNLPIIGFVVERSTSEINNKSYYDVQLVPINSKREAIRTFKFNQETDGSGNRNFDPDDDDDDEMTLNKSIPCPSICIE